MFTCVTCNVLNENVLYIPNSVSELDNIAVLVSIQKTKGLDETFEKYEHA